MCLTIECPAEISKVPMASWCEKECTALISKPLTPCVDTEISSGSLCTWMLFKAQFSPHRVVCLPCPGWMLELHPALHFRHILRCFSGSEQPSVPGRVGMLSLHPSSLQFSRLPIPECFNPFWFWIWNPGVQSVLLRWCHGVSSIRKGNTEFSKTVFRHCESVRHPNESGTRCRPSDLSAKVVWMLQNLVSYWFLWLIILKGQIHYHYSHALYETWVYQYFIKG